MAVRFDERVVLREWPQNVLFIQPFEHLLPEQNACRRFQWWVTATFAAWWRVANIADVFAIFKTIEEFIERFLVVEVSEMVFPCCSIDSAVDVLGLGGWDTVFDLVEDAVPFFDALLILSS